MKRTIAMVLALMMVLALVPIVGLQTALAAAPSCTVSIKSYPARTFKIGTELSLSGLVLSVTHKYGNGNPVPGYETPQDVVYPNNMTCYFNNTLINPSTPFVLDAATYKAGNYTVKVVYTGDVDGEEVKKTLTFSVSLTTAGPTASISVKDSPQIFYLPGEKLDLSKLTVNVVHKYRIGTTVDSDSNYTTPLPYDGDTAYHQSLSYKLGSTAIADKDDFTLDPNVYKSGDYVLTIYYTGEVEEEGDIYPVSASTTTTIKVRNEVYDSIAVISGLNTSKYFVGERLSFDGLKLGLLYRKYPTDTRTDTTHALTDFVLRDTDKDGVLLTPSSLPKFDADDVAEGHKIYAAYEDKTTGITRENPIDITYDVYDAPTGVTLTADRSANASGAYVYEYNEIGTTIATAWTAEIAGSGTFPSDTTNPAYVTWGSSNESVATISSAGKLTIVGPGEATIKVRTRGDGTQEAALNIKVKKDAIPVTGITLNKTDETLSVGVSTKLIAALSPSNTTDATVEWTVEHKGTNVLTKEELEEQGYFTFTESADTLSFTIAAKKALADGYLLITAKVEDEEGNAYTATGTVRTQIIPADDVYVSPTAVTIYEGQAYTLVGTVLPYDATDTTVTWTSSNEQLAVVKDGRVTAVDIADSAWEKLNNPKTGKKWTAADIAAGKCYTEVTITCAAASNPATANDTCVVTIKQGVVATQISLNKSAASLIIGGSTQLVATILPTNATTKTVSWVSSDPTIATVSSTGKLTAVKAGQCVVTATSNGSGDKDMTAKCYVTVSAVMSGSIGLSALNLSLYHNQTATLTATVIPSNTTNKEVTFTSSKPSVATVNASTGLITAISNGKTTITVTANDGSGATATCFVSVMDKVAVTKLTMSMKDFSLLLNDTTQLSVMVTPDYASVTDVTWSSSNPTVVSVDENGKVSGLVAGQSATITATSKDGTGISASVGVSVVNNFYGNGKVVNCLRRVNVREQASGSSKFKGYAYLNETFKVLGKSGNWYKIRYGNETCYIWSAYIRLVGDGTAEYTSAGRATVTTPTTGTGTSTGTPTKCTVTNVVYAVNVRSGPGTTYSKVGIAALNTSYEYIGTYGDWYKLKFNATTEAYIHSNYIYLS